MLETTNMENFKNFKEHIEIDYFTYFTKTYLALNAFIKANFREKTDREKIDNLKNDQTIRDRFAEILKDIFKIIEEDFMNQIYRAQIFYTYNNNKILINPEKIKIQSFECKEYEYEYKKITYKIKFFSGKEESVGFECFNKNGQIAKIGKCKYSDLEARLNETKLTEIQKSTIEGLFKEKIDDYNCNLNKILSEYKENDSKEKNITKIYKSFIEIIYSLRNALFHSEINPNKEAIQKTYETAYILLKKFIYILPEEGIIQK